MQSRRVKLSILSERGAELRFGPNDVTLFPTGKTQIGQDFGGCLQGLGFFQCSDGVGSLIASRLNHSKSPIGPMQDLASVFAIFGNLG